MKLTAGVHRVETPGSLPRTGLGPRLTPPRRPQSPSSGPGPAPARGAPEQQPRPVAGGLTGLLCDDTPAPSANRSLAAARGFASGTCFFAGQVVDRAL